ncbi:MAG: DeoR/GlpR transcriptional regulator [Niabella sp.]|nr:DeoR/GlpR transcriptional regulator [Niabella sp.]
MFKEERYAYILKKLKSKHRVLVADLTIEMEVSPDTVRRDLQELEEKKLLIKVHGGALPADFGTLH